MSLFLSSIQRPPQQCKPLDTPQQPESTITSEMANMKRRLRYLRCVNLALQSSSLRFFHPPSPLNNFFFLLPTHQTNLDIPRTRPALSLLAYCSYHNQDYARAAEFYEELVALCPETEEYQVYFTQSLVMAEAFLDATRVSSAITSSSSHSQRWLLLKAQAELEEGLLSASSSTLARCMEDDPETILSLATVEYRAGKYSNALEKYRIAKEIMGKLPMLSYFTALCHYKLGQYDLAMDLVDGIIAVMREEQLGTDNPKFWQQESTFVVEAFNLKAALCHEAKQHHAAKDVLKELCELHDDENLDTITIHNDAIINLEKDPSVGMQKLSYLLSNASFPPETLGNLLTVYVSHGQEDAAAELFESNKQHIKELIPPELYAYLNAAILSFSSPHEAYSMLETLVAKYTPRLRASMKQLEVEAQASSSPASTSRPATASRRGAQSLADATQTYATLVEDYIPILMLQAKLHWDEKQYERAEELLCKSADFCRGNDSWRLNMSHCLLAQQNKYEECIQYYELELMAKEESETDLLKVPANALANLCLAYVMTNQNEAAEAIMKAVEQEEHQQSAIGNERTYHSCMINLVIGTLYCEKGNFEFGISRVCKSLEPFNKNLSQDTWFYTKRCLLTLASKVAKLMAVLKDNMIQEIMYFLDDVETNCKQFVLDGEEVQLDSLTIIASEARQLKHIFIKLCA